MITVNFTLTSCWFIPSRVLKCASREPGTEESSCVIRRHSDTLGMRVRGASICINVRERVDIARDSRVTYRSIGNPVTAVSSTDIRIADQLSPTRMCGRRVFLMIGSTVSS